MRCIDPPLEPPEIDLDDPRYWMEEEEYENWVDHILGCYDDCE